MLHKDNSFQECVCWKSIKVTGEHDTFVGVGNAKVLLNVWKVEECFVHMVTLLRTRFA